MNKFDLNNCRKVLLGTLNDPSSDPRPYRIIWLLKSMNYRIDLISFLLESNLPIENHFELIIKSKENSFKNLIRKIKFVLIRLLVKFYIPHDLFKKAFLDSDLYPMRFDINDIVKKIGKDDYSIIIIEDLYLLPLALKYKKNAKVIFDAREYYPKQNEDRILFRILEQPLRYHICDKYMSKCDLVITVSSGLADAYLNEFNVQAKVIQSTPLSYYCEPKKTEINKIQMVHHGGANCNRRLETMIQLFDYLDKRFSLDFYLVGNPDYVNVLKQLAQNNPAINFRDPVDFNDIIPMLSAYDIGLYFFTEPSNFNIRHCLPNKLFEFIQARLMVAIGPAPEMSKIVQEYGCGVVSDDYLPGSLADCLNQLTLDDVFRYKQKSHDAAKVLNWEQESLKLTELLENL
ncbi:hypothetical protein L3556_01345 [Candidatus Synechococcus calcipolaris G9]|uniref:Uncharacterized protein n=1 Tax=Candidatus Synechococcus calcipolaris G9 TaxID=1497997 RepID=A0ABT6EUR0_9SYNE|nr:hypothetical protein [Candidatus Synechococcus calcipolaris]MDG2989582.1 hypothetical protein [Candidatus Synechococcus calcipolaris G9]